ncbi:hypothetical protein [Nocardioides convexus]|uniref:hypothetical protein n=1 Tax=Nocardioides convexus TaxID=2712224 RepID=UPI00241835F4|nr:hypothetical protein [Nocardioides convexus]
MAQVQARSRPRCPRLRLRRGCGRQRDEDARHLRRLRHLRPQGVPRGAGDGDDVPQGDAAPDQGHRLGQRCDPGRRRHRRRHDPALGRSRHLHRHRGLQRPRDRRPGAADRLHLRQRQHP